MILSKYSLCHSEERSDEESRSHVILESFTNVKDEESQGGAIFIAPLSICPHTRHSQLD